MASVSFNPNQQTQPQNSFLLEASGWIQGLSMDNQPSRIQRETGNYTGTAMVWGGMMINRLIPTINKNQQGPSIEIATAQQTDFAFTTNDGWYSALLVPGNDVPYVGAGTVNYYPNGKWTRLPVACSASLAAALEGGLMDQEVYWDFPTQTLTNSGTTPIPGARVRGFNSNSLIVSQNSTTLALSWAVGTCALLEF